MDNSRIHQNSRRITATLQQSLLPPMLPRIDGLDVAAQYVPAGDGLDVGGDFYDVVPLAQHGWMLVLGDVSGKGVGAAAVTGLVRDVLHALALDYREPQQTLNRLNETLVQRGWRLLLHAGAGVSHLGETGRRGAVAAPGRARPADPVAGGRHRQHGRLPRNGARTG